MSPRSTASERKCTMSWSINVPGIRTQDRQLIDSAHDRLLATASISNEVELPVPGGKAKLGSGATASVELFNGPEDKDEGCVIGAPPEDAEPSDPTPIFQPSANGCFLKFGAQVA